MWKQLLWTFTKLRKATVSFVMSVCLSAPTGRIVTQADIWAVYEKIRITGILHEDSNPANSCGMRNVSTECCTENHNTHFTFRKFFPKIVPSKNMVEPERPQITIWRRIACWIRKATRAQLHARPSAHSPQIYTHTYSHARTHVHIQEHCLTAERGTDKLSWNVGNYKSTLRHIREKRRSNI